MTFSLRCSFLLFVVVLVFSSFGFTQSKFEKGLDLYKKGDYKNAIKILKKDKKNITSIYYLGLSYEKSNETKEAEKAFKKSFLKGVVLVKKQLAKNTGLAEIRKKVRDKFSNDIENAALSGMEYSRINPEIKTSEEWQKNLIIINMFRETPDFSEKLYFSDEVTTKLQVLSKPFPGYTDEARRRGESGRIKLLVGFLKTGNIGFVVPIKTLNYGLTEKAIFAANRVKFKPARKDDEAVSYVALIYYSFAIY